MSDLLGQARELLGQQGLSPKKGYGQNFLIDGKALDKIVSSLELDGIEQIVEIGPGLGFLTERLLGLGLPLEVIEADPDMVTILISRFKDRIGIRLEDCLKTDLNMFHVKHTLFVGNLPYNITKAIIERLSLLPPPAFFSLMVQAEVAAKLEGTAHPLGAFLNIQGRFVSKVPVGRRSFFPVPKVDSVFFNYRLENCYGTEEYKFLTGLYRQPNKTVANNLLALGKSVDGVDPVLLKMRPRQLSLSSLLQLVALLA